MSIHTNLNAEQRRKHFDELIQAVREVGAEEGITDEDIPEPQDARRRQHYAGFRVRLVISDLMKAKGISQTELATRSALSQQSVTNYLAGKGLPGLHSAICIADTLGCKVDDIFIRVPPEEA